MLYVFALFALFLYVGRTDAKERACNSSPELCSKPYDTVTYLGAHDSPFLRDASTSFSTFGNQIFRTTTQLDAGVRLLSAQVHIHSNEYTRKRELHVCHTSCALFDAGPLLDWLIEIRMWLDGVPNEVVTVLLVNSDGVDAKELAHLYAVADIARYGYIPPTLDQAPALSNDTDPTWPTLDEMITKGQRLVTFVNPVKPDRDNAPYLLNEFTFVWENDYNVTSPDKFACTPDRPSNMTIDSARQSGRLFLMNHFLYWKQAFGIQVPDDRHVNTTNAWDGPGALGSHMIKCSNQVSRQPTFVLVDFFNVGPAIDTIDIFNKVSHPVDRFEVTDEVILEPVSLYRGSAKALDIPLVIVGIVALAAGVCGLLA